MAYAGTFTSFDLSPESLFIAILGTITTLGGAAYARRGNRDVAQLQAEQGAYTRASTIDAGVVARLEAENQRLTEGWAADRAQHALDREEWRQEADRLEARIRELLSEVVALRNKHELDRRPPGSG